MRGSMKQMKELVSTGSVQTFKFQMSNVKTWLSAALTNEYTCTNGFEDFHDDGSIKDDGGGNYLLWSRLVKAVVRSKGLWSHNSDGAPKLVATEEEGGPCSLLAVIV
ncbi:unnamed protein product [Brassica napus]|uniref:(rape) hypothetical protein n=1 Tax=Brassica napus TaxID=3708 RepID=A0A816JQT3_BRANA|nr:unnamed protein product [Brassica napus]